MGFISQPRYKPLWLTELKAPSNENSSSSALEYGKCTIYCVSFIATIAAPLLVITGAFFDSHKNCVYSMISARPAGRLAHRPSVRRGKNCNTIFSDTISMVNVKLCTMMLLIELYPFIPLSVTFNVFEGHSSVKQY